MFQNLRNTFGKPVDRERQEELFKKESLHILEKEIKTKVPASFHEHPFNEGWPEITNFIREALNKQGQEDFIKRLLKTGRYKNMDELAKFLVHVNNIPWFKPQSKLDPEMIKSLVWDTIKSLGLNSTEKDGGKWDHFDVKEIKILESDWNEANEASRNLLKEPLDNSNRRELTKNNEARNQLENLGSLHSMIWGMIWGQSKVGRSNSPISTATNVVEGVVKWITFKYTKDNPYSSLITLFEMGLWPIGIEDRGINNRNFIVFIPPATK